MLTCKKEGGIRGSFSATLDPWLGGSLRVELSAFFLLPTRLGRARAILPRRLDGTAGLRRGLWNPVGSSSSVWSSLVVSWNACRLL